MSDQHLTTGDKLSVAAGPILGIALATGVMFTFLYGMKVMTMKVARSIK